MTKAINFKFILQNGFIIIITAYLLLIAGNTLGMINFDIQIVNLILLVAIGAVWLFKPGKQRIPLKNAILLWVFVYLITIIFSIDPRRSIEQFQICLISIFIFAAAGGVR